MLNIVKNAFLSEHKLLANEIQMTIEGFDKAEQWLDFVKSLKRLQTFFEKNTAVKKKEGVQFDFAPFIRPITDCLNKCLKDDLPSGIHLKALETYFEFFSNLTNDQIVKNFNLFCEGLFPVIRFGQERVLVKFFEINTCYIVPVVDKLSEALIGIIHSFLPGLAEPHSELFSRTKDLLDKIWTLSNNNFYVSCLWNCFVFSSPHRLYIINYLNRSIENASLEVSRKLLSDNKAVLLKAILHGLKDPNTEVVIATINLYLKYFPCRFSVFTLLDLNKIFLTALLAFGESEKLNSKILTIINDIQNGDESNMISNYLIMKTLRELMYYYEKSSESKVFPLSILDWMLEAFPCIKNERKFSKLFIASLKLIESELKSPSFEHLNFSEFYKNISKEDIWNNLHKMVKSFVMKKTCNVTMSHINIVLKYVLCALENPKNGKTDTEHSITEKTIETRYLETQKIDNSDLKNMAQIFETLILNFGKNENKNIEMLNICCEIIKCFTSINIGFESVFHFVENSINFFYKTNDKRKIQKFLNFSTDLIVKYIGSKEETEKLKILIFEKTFSCLLDCNKTLLKADVNAEVLNFLLEFYSDFIERQQEAFNSIIKALFEIIEQPYLTNKTLNTFILFLDSSLYQKLRKLFAVEYFETAMCISGNVVSKKFLFLCRLIKELIDDLETNEKYAEGKELQKENKHSFLTLCLDFIIGSVSSEDEILKNESLKFILNNKIVFKTVVFMILSKIQESMCIDKNKKVLCSRDTAFKNCKILETLIKHSSPDNIDLLTDTIDSVKICSVFYSGKSQIKTALFEDIIFSVIECLRASVDLSKQNATLEESTFQVRFAKVLNELILFFQETQIRHFCNNFLIKHLAELIKLLIFTFDLKNSSLQIELIITIVILLNSVNSETPETEFIAKTIFSEKIFSSFSRAVTMSSKFDVDLQKNFMVNTKTGLLNCTNSTFSSIEESDTSLLTFEELKKMLIFSHYNQDHGDSKKQMPTLAYWAYLYEAICKFCLVRKNADKTMQSNLVSRLIDAVCVKALVFNSLKDVHVLVKCLCNFLKQCFFAETKLYRYENTAFRLNEFLDSEMENEVINVNNVLKEIALKKVPNVWYVFGYLIMTVEKKYEEEVNTRQKELCRDDLDIICELKHIIYDSIGDILSEDPVPVLKGLLFTWENTIKIKIELNVQKTSSDIPQSDTFSNSIHKVFVKILNQIPWSNPAFIVHNICNIIESETDLNKFSVCLFLDNYIRSCDLKKLCFSWSSIKSMTKYIPPQQNSDLNNSYLILWILNIFYVFFVRCGMDINSGVHLKEIQHEFFSIFDFLLTSVGGKSRFVYDKNKKLCPPIFFHCLGANIKDQKFSFKSWLICSSENIIDLPPIYLIDFKTEKFDTLVLKCFSNVSGFLFGTIWRNYEKFDELSTHLISKYTLLINSESIDRIDQKLKNLTLISILTLFENNYMLFKPLIVKNFKKPNLFKTESSNLKLWVCISDYIEFNVENLCSNHHLKSLLVKKPGDAVHNIKSLAFVMFCKEENFFSRHFEKFVSNLFCVESILKSITKSPEKNLPDLLEALFLLLRVLIVRSTLETANEALEEAMRKIDVLYRHEKMLSLSHLCSLVYPLARFLDLLSVVQAEWFFARKWTFFPSSCTKFHDSSDTSFAPVLMVILDAMELQVGKQERISEKIKRKNDFETPENLRDINRLIQLNEIFANNTLNDEKDATVARNTEKDKMANSLTEQSESYCFRQRPFFLVKNLKKKHLFDVAKIKEFVTAVDLKFRSGSYELEFERNSETPRNSSPSQALMEEIDDSLIHDFVEGEFE